jgi:hypothetical protein
VVDKYLSDCEHLDLWYLAQLWSLELPMSALELERRLYDSVMRGMFDDLPNGAVQVSPPLSGIYVNTTGAALAAEQLRIVHADDPADLAAQFAAGHGWHLRLHSNAVTMFARAYRLNIPSWWRARDVPASDAEVFRIVEEAAEGYLAEHGKLLKKVDLWTVAEWCLGKPISTQRFKDAWRKLPQRLRRGHGDSK